MLRATTSNIEMLSEPNGLLNASKVLAIPQTVLDAIGLTQYIDEQYLWVDSLCIIQDGPKDKHVQIKDMDCVYAGAVLTIVAAGGDDANAGLAGVRPGSRKVKQIVEKVSPETSLASPLPLQFKLDSSTWNIRAWTYQERLLSRRLLIFDPQGVYWQCRTLMCPEDLILEGANIVDSNMMSVRDRFRFLDVDPEWYNDASKRNNVGKTYIQLLRPPALTQYMWTLEEYTGRKLSYPEDILNAFTAIQNIVNTGLRSTSWYGLPSKHLDIALLWQPAGLMHRRVELPYIQDPQPIFPSWSWAGWVGNVLNSTLSSGAAEEDVRPLLHWHSWDPINGMCKLPQFWESAAQGHQQLDPQAWTPIDCPADSLPASLAIPDSLLRQDWLYCRTSSATFTIGERGMDRFPSFTFNVHNRDMKFAGLVIMHFNATPGSTCKFLVVSEAQSVGQHDSQAPRRYSWERFAFYNVLAVTWNGGVASRVGVGRISKEAWGKADPEWKDAVLG